MRSETHELESMKKIIRQATTELMDYGRTTPEATCAEVAQDHPDLYAAVGADRVFALCWEIHESSEPAESAWLQELFATFNTKYFRGQLGDFTALAVYNAGGASTHGTSGWVDFVNRQILIELTEY